MASPSSAAVGENALTGYVALSVADAKAFDELGELRPEVFDYPGVWGRFIPLDMSVQAAIDAALLQGTSSAFEAAASETEWHVLKLRFAGRAIADMYHNYTLVWSAARYGLELRSAIKAEWLVREDQAGPQAEMFEVVLPRVHFDQWGDKVLSAQFWLQKSTWRAECQECSSSGYFTWKAEPGFGGGEYCARCWHAHCKSADHVCDSLHAPFLKPEASPGAAAEGVCLEAETASSKALGSPWHLQEASEWRW